MMPHAKCDCYRNYEEVAMKEMTGRGLLAKKQPASKDLGLSETVATKLAVDALDDYTAPRLELPKCRFHGVDFHCLPYTLFDALDQDLFRGVLKDQVFLQWGRLDSEIHGVTTKPGLRDKRITIQLNSLLQRQSHSPCLISCLIHHMAHAYFLVCCGFQRRGDQTSHYNLGHGLGFSTLIHRIREVFRPVGIKVLPASSNRSLKPPDNHLVEMNRHKSRSAQRGGRSFCPWSGSDMLAKEPCQDHMLALKEMKLQDDKVGESCLQLYW
ncbi:hypothetical protein PRK78_006648 [Emydomyces testavorans]|uniref:SprT-like domain-containing protein n=1 Tax=Emydomyces testavorans TaxID=2070801 RepID=A0AAF0DMI8_9EURO|nr:hypothetical protein PRK78_006648 [Emydomyces testavorans]